MILLGVNIDHCATLRQARYRPAGATLGGNIEPDPVALAFLCEKAGADDITVHLREDRRHIHELDVRRLAGSKTTRLNLEMACTPAMIEFALRLKPYSVCLVPESREEITTEGGLDIVKNRAKVARVTGLYVFEGMRRVEVQSASSGDLVCLAGLENVVPGDTIVTPEGPDVRQAGALERISVGEPTLAMVFSVNDGPFAGKSGKYVTSRHIRDRLMREIRGNVSIRVLETDTPDKFKVLGRGGFQLAVLIESMRREGYEMCVSRPEVVVKEEGGNKKEPLEGLVVNIPETAIGSVTELVGKRGGKMVGMDSPVSGWTSVEYEIPTRGLIGFLGSFRTITRGEGQMSTYLKGWIPYIGEVEARQAGAMISTDLGRTTPYAIFNLQPRGVMFVSPGEDVYEGMVVGEHARDNDLDINIVREKKLTNIRAAGRDENIILTPAKKMRLEEAMEWIDMDELIEVSPDAIRIRKRGLKPHERSKRRRAEAAD